MNRQEPISKKIRSRIFKGAVCDVTGSETEQGGKFVFRYNFQMGLSIPDCIHLSGGVNEPPVRYKPVIDAEVLASVAPETLNDSYVYVHCYFQNQWKDALVRIWKTTFLVDKTSGARSGLIHAENISIAPLWTLIPDNSMHTFLLVFAALPKSCKQFDLLEDIPQPGGFHVADIFRNQQDVYHIDL